jgi:hypothetical protein
VFKIIIDFKDVEKGFNNLIRYVSNDRNYFEAQDAVRDLAYETALQMREEINSSRKRPARASHKLDNAITAEDLTTTGGIEVGIGRISTLNAEAPYWEMINDGASYTTKTKHIVPFEDGEFRTFQVGSTHVIEGIDFVGKAIRNLDKELRVKMESWGEKFLGEMGK